MKQIINFADAPTSPVGIGAKFVAEFASLAVVPPGKRAFPKHAHRVNEEMMFGLEGEGPYHCGTEAAPIKAGDLIAAPPGDAATAYQIENTSAKPLRYLTISTKLEPEVVEYPDSGKFGVTSFAGSDRPTVRFLGRKDTSLDYFDGEH